MIITNKVRWQLKIQKTIFYLLLVTATVLLAWFSTQYPSTFDWTSNNRNTLSKGSIDVLNTLTDPVTVYVFIQDNDSTKDAVDVILKRFKRIKKDFNYKIVNPDLEIELTQQENISRYDEIVISYQGRKEKIPSLNEQVISSALLRLSRTKTINLVFLKGHGERSLNENNNISYDKLAQELTIKGIRSRAHNLIENKMPADTDVLVIAAPDKKILAGELEQIKTYINNGGNLLWMMDPGGLQGLEELAALLDIQFMDGMVVDNNVDLRNTLQIQHPAVIPVLEYLPHVITQEIKYYTMFPISRGITSDKESGWNPFGIIQSLPKSWSETSALSADIVFQSETGDIAGPITIGVALERIITAENSTPTKASQRIVVIGDSDFLANSYIGAGANLTLGLNIINWLAGDDDLIAIEPKNAPDLHLELDDTTTLIIGAGFLIVIPVCLLVTGFSIWFRRRKQ